MKAIVCEMCGSQELIKKNGVFICEHCKTKYDPEEVRKLVIEGPVRIQGPVRIDRSDELKNLLILAKRAKDANDVDKAVKLYEKIALMDPSNWEAAFYPDFYRAMKKPVTKFPAVCDSLKKATEVSLEIVRDTVTDVREIRSAVSEIADKVLMLSDRVFGGISGLSPEMISMVAPSAIGLDYFLGNTIDSAFPVLKDITVKAWKAGILNQHRVLTHLQDPEAQKQMMAFFIHKTRQYDPSFRGPRIPTYTKEQIQWIVIGIAFVLFFLFVMIWGLSSAGAS